MAKVFCTSPRLKEFHNLFISCNEVVNVTEWCCKCEKCAFVYIILSAFLPPPQVQAVFHGRDLFSDESMSRTFLSLVGGCGDGTKPFECVGTFSETQAAVEMSLGVLMRQSSEEEEEEGEGGGCRGCVPQGLQQACQHVGLSTERPPEFADLPLDAQFTAVMSKYVTA